MKDQNKTITYYYNFKFSNGLEKDFLIDLDKDTLNLIKTKREKYPPWTELNFNKCTICSLDSNDHKYCPVAVNLIDVINFFKEAKSYEEVNVLVKTEERNYTKNTTLQRGISSLIGIYMVTSGCPILTKLKPMVRYHLPFATIEETKYRAITMYLLSQYFLYKRGKDPDWEMKNLVNLYDNIRLLNMAFSKRLSGIVIKDATLNAMNNLHCFAENINFGIIKDKLDDIEILFDLDLL